MLTLRRSEDRGHANHGWLDSHHSFSFADYRDDDHVHFGPLRVINEDRIDAGTGFGAHPHRDMEIISYVLDGELAHEDSMGNKVVIRPGEVQRMSAGTGVRHSEFNSSAADPLHFLQIWITPNTKGVAPRYQQVHFAPEEKRGRLRLIVSPEGTDGSLTVHQDARVYAGLFDGDESASLELGADRHAYVHVARGSVELNGQRLGEGDGARLRGEQRIELARGEGAEVLVFDLRPNELPSFQ